MKASAQHISIITSEFPPQPGGIGDHAYNLALQLSENGYQVNVIADQRSIDGIEESVFDASLSFKVRRIKITSPRVFMYFHRLFALIKYTKISHHVIATGKFPLWTTAFCSLFFKRNYLAVIHGTEVNFKPYLLRTSINIALKRFRTIIAVSKYTKQLIAHLHLNVVVIPNGFNLEKWKQNLNISFPLEGYPKLITVGNVTSRKGQQNVIKHLPKLIETFPQIHFHCIGLKTEANDFEMLAKQLEVFDYVTFHGRKDDAELQSMLMESDIFIMLSSETTTGDVEGFGIAILEANALGVPAIGSIGCGIEDAIDANRSGMLIDAFDSEALVVAISSILNETANFEIGAKTWAKEHLWTDVIQSYIPYLK